ncbi:heavy metal-associated isoprenylated plant protein 34-like [Gastrolobium bilobum]|uniref:heavy metal-associated isoprenylated plant protein 34-like n=1 Tax=Gastrolobium bilobum TaxID=150636 RepID=UPI002AAFFB14|nr:heavy metal-associated isoprenylated plant protein 34-like [Gastrolobium bilobum]
MEINRHMNCVLRVDTRSRGWENSITKLLKRVKDVSFTIDTESGIIRISGKIDPNKLLTDIKRAGKHAELIYAECGEHSRYNYGSGYGYNGGYEKMEPQYSYPYYESQPHYGFNAKPSHVHLLPPPSEPAALCYEPYNGGYEPNRFNGRLALTAGPRHVPLLPPPSAPPQNKYNPNDPSCNIM